MANDATGPASRDGDPSTRYLEPGGLTDKVFNRLVNGLTRLGISVWGSRELRVRGRKSGEWRKTPVNLLRHDGRDYLVAPRGHTQWVRNIRVSGEGELRVGRRVRSFRAVEVADDDKAPILRAYLKRWKFEVGVFFDGVDADAPDETLRSIAPGYPVFEVVPA
ncbi:MAG: nitroreductase family deazaflavin-dependent oxidoreductase [Actinomycetota bacterium]|nr:nitroreductase family deazaflavin-dependent oxidoreductase [Actinomycetota bacterium]